MCSEWHLGNWPFVIKSDHILIKGLRCLYVVFNIPLENILLIWKHRVAKFFLEYRLWAGRDLYRAAPVGTRASLFCSQPKSLSYVELLKTSFIGRNLTYIPIPAVDKLRWTRMDGQSGHGIYSRQKIFGGKEGDKKLHPHFLKT
jgi:hypothetical protein